MEAGIVEFERGEAEGEDVTLVLADRLIVPLAPLYRRAACYGGEDRAEQKAVRNLARLQTGPRDYSDWAQRPMCLLVVRRIVRAQRPG